MPFDKRAARSPFMTWAVIVPESAIEAAQKIGADAGVKKPISAVDFDAALKQIGRGAPISNLT